MRHFFQRAEALCVAGAIGRDVASPLRKEARAAGVVLHRGTTPSRPTHSCLRDLSSHSISRAELLITINADSRIVLHHNGIAFDKSHEWPCLIIDVLRDNGSPPAPG